MIAKLTSVALAYDSFRNLDLFNGMAKSCLALSVLSIFVVVIACSLQGLPSKGLPH